MKAIGIDIGTTSICGVLIDADDGTVLRSVTKPNGMFVEPKAEFEKIQDAERILSVARGITDELSELARDTAVIGITGQMHGIVYFDAEGKPCGNLYTWQDGRGNEPFEDGKTYSEYLGVPSGYGFVTDFYNRRNGLVPADAAGYCTIQDCLAMSLTNSRKLVIHSGNAASFGDMDLETKHFNHDFCGRITDEYEIIGEYGKVPVCVPIGDNQASVFGALKEENSVLLNIGTGSQISVISSEILKGEGIESRPYMNEKYLVAGAALCGGRAYSMLERFFSDVVYAAVGKRVDMYSVMDKMSASNKSMKADTRFGGTRADKDLRGGIYNISTENFTPGELKNAVLTGIIAELYGMYSEMNTERKFLVGSGNGLRRNKSLVKIAEETFGLEMKMPKHLEEAAFGAALSGICAVSGTDGVKKAKELISYE